MNFLDTSIDRVTKLLPSERLLSVVAIAVAMYLVAGLALLWPQQKKLADLRNLDRAHRAEATALERDASSGADPLSADRAVLDGLKKQVADFDALLGPADATTSEVGSLLRELLDVSPGLTLVSLKTLPVTQFYAPERKESGGEKSDKEAIEIHKTIYRHGVEISVKGSYMALLSYMEDLQKYPKRLFWFEAKLDTVAYPDAVLKLVVYSLSEQASSPLR